MRKLFCAVVAALLAFGTLILPAAAAETGHNHRYYLDYITRSADGRTVESFGLFCEDCDEVTHIKTGGTVVDYRISYNGWGADGQTTWYFIDGLVSLMEPLRISGTVNLVLLDNSLLLCRSGIRIFNNSTLNIYAQHLDYSPAGRENTMGKLCAEVKDTSNKAAAIGGLWDAKNTTVNIYGGDISAYTVGYGAAIGSGMNGNTTVNIYGGKVRATSAGSGAAIGSGYNYADAEVNFYGGIVQATATDEFAASIGKGFWYCSAKVNFFGGYVYGEPVTTVYSHLAGITADSVTKAEGAKQLGDIDGFYDKDGLALARLAGWVDADNFPVGSILSVGNLWIVITVGVFAIGSTAALVIVKKKKKLATVNGAQGEDNG